MASIKKIGLVGGARPNFMKLAPIVRALEARRDEISYCLVHTGQHHDHGMSQVFFDELGIPMPHHRLEAGGGGHAEQTAKVMVGFEAICRDENPDCVMVVGDVNSTLACGIVAKKARIRLAHFEAGLRSFDRAMPEEINRLAVDAISDDFFVTEQSAVDNLLREGQSPDAVHFVGHAMVDNLLYQLDRLNACEIGSPDCPYDLAHSIEFKARWRDYAVLTTHRAANVDDPTVLSAICAAANHASDWLPIAFPVHPRTRQAIDRYGLTFSDRVICLPPLAYMDFLNLWRDARVVLTDSGGLQEETTALGVTCLTIRDNTERPITIEMGTNRLVGVKTDAIITAIEETLAAPPAPSTKRPPLWDGKAATRIADILLRS